MVPTTSEGLSLHGSTDVAVNQLVTGTLARGPALLNGRRICFLMAQILHFTTADSLFVVGLGDYSFFQTSHAVDILDVLQIFHVTDIVAFGC